MTVLWLLILGWFFEFLPLASCLSCVLCRVALVFLFLVLLVGLHVLAVCSTDHVRFCHAVCLWTDCRRLLEELGIPSVSWPFRINECVTYHETFIVSRTVKTSFEFSVSRIGKCRAFGARFSTFRTELRCLDLLNFCGASEA